MRISDPICIYVPGDKTFDAIPDLEDLLTNDILDRKIAVISIAGRYRQGKSFLMNFIIKYLRAKGAADWLDRDANGNLEGFEWRHTRHAVTKGVLIWPEVFKLRSTSGEQIIVILIDTQGVFDTKTTIADNTSIFSLSVLLSSIQIFNVRQNIQGDDLGHLQLFAECGRLVCSESSEAEKQGNRRPFQDLIFLVRDWSYPGQNTYGWNGGQELLKEVIEDNDVKGELARQRASIRDCFEEQKCYLMPHPGEKVNTSDEFRGHISDMTPEFVAHMKSFIEDIFRPENLKKKTVHGKELTVKDFVKFVELYVREMHSGNVPTPETLYDATVKATNSAVVNDCFKMYQDRITQLIYKDPREPARFEELHNSVLNEAVNHFNQSKMMGGGKAIAAALKDLKKQVADAVKYFTLVNSAAHDRKFFEAQSKKVEAEMELLKAQIKKFGDQAGELNRRLADAEKRQKDAEKAKKEAEDKLEALEEAKKKKGRCTIF